MLAYLRAASALRLRTFCQRKTAVMDDGSDTSISVQDVAPVSFEGQEHRIQTSHGPISVLVCGDQGKPALITYPDVALNHVSCFQGLFSCPEASNILLHNFCIYHIDPPGHEPGAENSGSDYPALSVDDLTDQVAEVLDYFGLREVICLGATAGAYILTLFALNYRERVQGLILVSPLCHPPSWTEWLYNKAMANLLFFYGMCGFVKETLLQRYFSQEIRSMLGEGSDLLQFYNRVLEKRNTKSVVRYLQAINQRKGLSEYLRKLKCRTLIIVGENSPFHSEALHISMEMDRRYNALIEVQACGSLVTEEQPHSMLIPIEYFLMGYAFYRPIQLTHSAPTSPLSPPCVSPELLSPESLGIKLKPIKTRVSNPE